MAEQSSTEVSRSAAPLDSEDTKEQLDVARRAALKDLDMAVMMGGPGLQAYAHKMIKGLMSAISNEELLGTATIQNAEGKGFLQKDSS